jgi:hypothetical protein
MVEQTQSQRHIKRVKNYSKKFVLLSQTDVVAFKKKDEEIKITIYNGR